MNKELANLTQSRLLEAHEERASLLEDNLVEEMDNDTLMQDARERVFEDAFELADLYLDEEVQVLYTAYGLHDRSGEFEQWHDLAWIAGHPRYEVDTEPGRMFHSLYLNIAERLAEVAGVEL